MRIVFRILAMFAVLGQPAYSQTLEDGVSLFRAGQYKQASDVFWPLAQKGDVNAASWHAEAFFFDIITNQKQLSTEAKYLLAYPFFKPPAEAGDANSQARMCQILMPKSSEISPNDPSVAEALSWCILSANAGDMQAKKNVTFWSRRLPPSVVQDAEQLASEFEPVALPVTQ